MDNKNMAGKQPAASVARPARRRKRLAPSQKYEIFTSTLTTSATQRELSEKYGVDRTTIRSICATAKQGAIDALTAAVPGRRGQSAEQVELAQARAEIERLKATICEQALTRHGTSCIPPCRAPFFLDEHQLHGEFLDGLRQPGHLSPGCLQLHIPGRSTPVRFRLRQRSHRAIAPSLATCRSTGSLQDPNVAMGDCVIEVIELRAVRLLLSTGGPRVVAEAIIERDGRASGHQLVGSTLSDQLVRSVSASSGVGRALQHHVDYLSQVS